jgi:hypothetical protein
MRWAVVVQLLLVVGCANPDATIEGKTGVFASWVPSACLCFFSKAGSLGTTVDTVTFGCWPGKPSPESSDLQVDAPISLQGARLLSLSSATGSLPSSGHPYSVTVVTDAVGGPIEPVPGSEGRRHRMPVLVLKARLVPSRSCDQFTEAKDECVDVSE